MTLENPVDVAVLGMIGSALIVGVPATISAISARRVHKAIGERPQKNGTRTDDESKTLMDMMHQSIEWQNQHGQLDESEFNHMKGKIQSIEDVLAERSHRFEEIDASLGALNAYTHKRWHDFDNARAEENLRNDVVEKTLKMVQESLKNQDRILDKVEGLTNGREKSEKSVGQKPPTS